MVWGNSPQVTYISSNSYSLLYDIMCIDIVIMYIGIYNVTFFFAPLYPQLFSTDGRTFGDVCSLFYKSWFHFIFHTAERQLGRRIKEHQCPSSPVHHHMNYNNHLFDPEEVTVMDHMTPTGWPEPYKRQYTSPAPTRRSKRLRQTPHTTGLWQHPEITWWLRHLGVTWLKNPAMLILYVERNC